MKISHDDLKSLVKYDPETGEFIRLVTTGWRSHAGSVAGDMDAKGYWRLRVKTKRYLAHRLAWFYVTGEWPPCEIDHINRIRTDNRWKNLRLADRFQNKRNTPAYRNNKSGFKGVSWSATSKKWRSRIRIGGKEVNLGLFETPEEANKAYLEKAREHFGQYARA